MCIQLKDENEVHFLFKCNSYSTLRDNFTNSISSIVLNYLKLNNDQKLIYLMTYLYLIVLREGKSPSCHLVNLPNKFAFEENKLINLGRVLSMTVFLYFVNF